MKLPSDTQEKMLAAYQMLQVPSLSVATFEQVRTMVKGIHPGIDKKLELCSKAISKMQKIQQMDVISLTAEGLPEDTEKNKKKKKAILFLINSLKDLQSEIKRVTHEFSHQSGNNTSVSSWGRIIKYAKGPLGLITAAAILIVVVSSISHKGTTSQKVAPSPTQRQTQQVIQFNGKQIPVSQLHIGYPHVPGCDGTHYHAISGSVTAVDGTVMQDPGGCGFGKVADTQVITISK